MRRITTHEMNGLKRYECINCGRTGIVCDADCIAGPHHHECEECGCTDIAGEEEDGQAD
jgi:predicted RNA-binding Zn-ribbon protein involved in translation (DUF1610 family)